MKAFDLQRMAFDKVPPEFLGEVALRSLYTFVLVFLFLKITGRRGVRQMSLFEVLIILTLGSAAGDVAFYDDVPMVPVFIVFVTLALLYRLVMWLMSKSEKLEDLLEGKPVVIVEDGQLAWENVQSANMTEFEFFMELRLNSVEQLGQVRLALTGQHYLNEGGSITLISGIVAHEPIAQGVNATTVNAALEGFVRAAACELPRGIRINLISPTVLTESVDTYDGFFPGFESVPAATVAQAYRRSVEGVQTGRVYKVGY